MTSTQALLYILDDADSDWIVVPDFDTHGRVIRLLVTHRMILELALALARL